VNHLADRTEKELKVLRGRRTSTGYNGGLPFKPDMSTINDIPDTINWNLRGMEEKCYHFFVSFQQILPLGKRKKMTGKLV